MSDQKREVRFSAAVPLEVRNADADEIAVTGYAAVFGERSQIGPVPGWGWQEVIERGAFADALQRGDNVAFLINHAGLPLARTASGTHTVSRSSSVLFRGRGHHASWCAELRILQGLRHPAQQRGCVRSRCRSGRTDLMSFSFTPAPPLPSLNDPNSFNDRTLAMFGWVVGTHIAELEAFRVTVGDDFEAKTILLSSSIASSESDLSFTANAVVSGEASISYTLSGANGYWRWMKDATDNVSGTSGATEFARLDVDGVLTINGNATLQTSVVIANDAVATIAVPRQGCFVAIMCGGNSDNVQNLASGIVQLDTGSSPAQTLVHGGANFSVTTTPLTGTTGAANSVTVHANDDQTFQIENRRGAPYTFLITVI